ncbi:MAG: hypothetical protein F4179_06180 [Gammaproteobacteria bacterium]|nr:hypothetical protein [Gammaproteobacteria bacterium]MYF61246.1 hypothetical protein [Gammaproteobacteria bacterium]MYI23635.1 hypothetical protein [Gammaproteobacteria bacterium]
MTLPTSFQPRHAIPDLRGASRSSGPGTTPMAACGLLLTVLATACGGGAGGAPGNSPDAPAADEAQVRSYPPNEVSRAEIDERGANAHTAMQFLRRVRPAWLRSRGSNSLTSAGAMYPVVYIDNIRRPGGLSALFQVPLSEVRRMEFIGPGDATTRWGTGHQSGVILIVTGR